MSAGVMQGANADDLVALSRAMSAKAAQIDTLRKNLGARLHMSTWKGRDAQAFRQQWESRLSPVLAAAAADLRSSSERLGQEAQAQTSASTASSGASDWRAMSAGIAALGFAERLRELAHDNRNIHGRYNKRWDRVIAIGGDAFRYKRWNVLQKAHLYAGKLEALGSVGLVAGVITGPISMWQAVRDGDGHDIAHSIGDVIDTSGGVIHAVATLAKNNPAQMLGRTAGWVGVNVVIWTEVHKAYGEAVPEFAGLGTTLRNSSPKDIGLALGEGALEAAKRLSGWTR